MIAVDTSSLVAYFNGMSGVGAERLATALAAGDLVIPPIVGSKPESAMRSLPNPASIMTFG